MEFDIGNLLYVVITLVAVIIGLLGRKKKPAATGTGTGENASGGGFMENLERAFNMGQEEQLVVDLEEEEEEALVEEPHFDTVNSADVTPEVPSLMSEYQQYLEQSAEPGRDPTGPASGEIFESSREIILAGSEEIAEPLEVINLDDDPGTNYFEVIKDFDAGTAIVYSAIINRIDY